MAALSLTGWVYRNGLMAEGRLQEAGFPHGVTTRELGDMRRTENRLAALKRSGLGGRRWYDRRQLHGTDIARLESGGDLSSGTIGEGDGWVTARPGAAVLVYVADCAPLFLWSSEGIPGVFHVGWRGARAGFPRIAVEALCAACGCQPSQVRAAIGPRIGQCHYPVGPELTEMFGPESFETWRGQPHFDLGGEVAAQLERAGVGRDWISSSSDCTYCLPERYFSFRRDKGREAMMAFVGMPS